MDNCPNRADETSSLPVAIGRTRSAVSTETHERRLHRRAHVVFAHHEIDRARLTVVCENQIEDRVERIFLLLLRDLRNRLPCNDSSSRFTTEPIKTPPGPPLPR